MQKDQRGVDFDRLEKTLSNWRVVVSEGPDDKLTAYSTSEPLFCVVRNSLEETNAIVERVIRSYISTFYGLSESKVVFLEEKIDKNVLPVERVVPIKKLSLKPRTRGSADEPVYAMG